VSSQYTDPLSFECIPDIDIVIVIARKQDSARGREGNRGDSAEDVVMGVSVEFTVCSKIE
jgi:biotin-(acetyl-CoA carboxylase) ligase